MEAGAGGSLHGDRRQSRVWSGKPSGLGWTLFHSPAVKAELCCHTFHGIRQSDTQGRSSAADKQALLLFGAGWPISPGHSPSVSVTFISSVSFDQQPNLLLTFLQTLPRQTVFWRALIIFFTNKSRAA